MKKMMILTLMELVKNSYDVILAVLIGVLFTSFMIKKLRRSSSSAAACAIPGRLGLPLLGETFSFLWAMNSTKGCYHFVHLRKLRYGNWFKTRLFGQVNVFVPSTAAARTILSDECQFQKTMIKSVSNAVGEKSIANLPAERLKRVRHLLSGPLSTDSLSKFLPKLDKLLSKRFNKLSEEGKSFSVLDFNMKLACDAMCEMLMSISDESLLNNIERECATITKGMMSFPFMIPGTEYYKCIKARERLMTLFQEIITERRNGPKEPAHEDFLSSMLDRDSFPPDEKLDDSEIKDNMLTLILGGQSTTATAIMWIVKFLDDNKDAQTMLRDEQLSIIRNKQKGDDLLCLQDIEKMSYGSKVVKETLRMANVALWIPRIALENCKIQEFEIKKGWIVNVDSTHIHFDPALYKDPEEFNPSRFDEVHKPYSYLPYGSGPRTCLGMKMANVIMLTYLHKLTTGYMWTVDDLDSRLEKGNFMPTLKSRLPITLTSLNVAS